MRRKNSLIVLVLALTSGLKVNAQDTIDTTNTENNRAYKKWFVGSSLLLLGNFDKTNNPEYILLNAGYRITPKDVVSIRFERFIYFSPRGIPLGALSDAPGLNFPGHVRINAPTIGYQRFWWKGLYTSVHALNGLEKYSDENKKRLEMDTHYIWTSI